MKLVSWNVNSLKQRMPRVLELLERHAPDVVCLQETKVTTAQFPHLELEAAGYTAVEHSGGRWNGVAVLGRAAAPPVRVIAGLPGEPDPGEARWVEADVAGLRLASVYVPNGRAPGTPTFAAKLAFYEAMAARAAALVAEGHAVVVTGDLNVVPTDADAWDASKLHGGTHTTPDERGRYREILAAGLVDAYRHLEADEPGFTWWDYRAGDFHNHRGLRIDLALVTADLAARLVACGIDRGFRKGLKPSDHAPLLVELLPPGRPVA